VNRPVRHPLVLLGLLLPGPVVAVRLREPGRIGTTGDVFLGFAILAFVTVCEVLRRRPADG
jgi:hypothetical protein